MPMIRFITITTASVVTFHEPIPGFVVAFPAGVGDWCGAGQQRGFGSQEPIGFEISGRKRWTGNGLCCRRRRRRRGDGGSRGRLVFVGIESDRFFQLSVVVVVVVATGYRRFRSRRWYTAGADASDAAAIAHTPVETVVALIVVMDVVGPVDGRRRRRQGGRSRRCRHGHHRSRRWHWQRRVMLQWGTTDDAVGRGVR